MPANALKSQSVLLFCNQYQCMHSKFSGSYSLNDIAPEHVCTKATVDLIQCTQTKILCEYV